MSKRITAIMIAFVMVFSVIGFIPAKAEAATKQAYVLIGKDGPYDKIGDYYVWADKNSNGIKKLKSSKFIGNGVTPKVIKTIPSGSKQEFLYYVVTNGETVYYAIGTPNKEGWAWEKVTVYKYDIKGNKNTAVKTFTDFDNLAGVHNGKIYFTKTDEDFYPGSLYSYNMSTKKIKFVKKAYGVDSAQGNNIIYWGENGTYRYNVVNGKTVKLPNVEGEFLIKGEKLYAWDWPSGRVDPYILREYDLNGKNAKIVKKINSKGEYMDDVVMGYKNMYFIDSEESGKTYKFNYSSKTYTEFVSTLKKVTLTSVKASGNKAITVTWGKVNNAKSYQVYRATAKNGTYKLVKTTTATSWKNTGLTKGKTYYYKVRALNGDTRGVYSAVKSAKAK